MITALESHILENHLMPGPRDDNCIRKPYIENHLMPGPRDDNCIRKTYIRKPSDA